MAKRIPSRTAPSATLNSAPARNQCRCPDPWWSHQDDIVVNSVEAGTTKRRAGVEHYLYRVSVTKYHTHTCTEIDEYHHSRPNPSDSPVADDQEDEVKQEEDVNDKPEYGTRYLNPPIPPARKEEYNYQIYKCTATNPAIFFAIARLAQQNLPFMNFNSAINHLPNLHPTSRLPKLQLNVAAENTPRDERQGLDEPVTVLFLPHFYHDRRHALGYYTFSPPATRRTSDKSKALMQYVKQILFTPCKMAELECYGLIAYAPQSTEREEPGGGKVQSVGATGGQWFQPNVVEDWDVWSESFVIVARVWQKRLGMCNPRSFAL